MSVASLEAKLDRLQAKKKKLEKRKSGVEKIVKKLGKKPEDDVDDIKKGGKDTAKAIEKGVTGVRHVDNLVDDLRASASSAHKLDTWKEKDWLNKEIRRLENEIDQLEREIKQVKADIREAKAAERAAALEKLKEAIT